jgi:hypothetical protein
VHVVEAVACVVLATWFAWSIADEDATPTVLAAASTVAAVIVVADIGVRLLRTRESTTRASSGAARPAGAARACPQAAEPHWAAKGISLPKSA